MLGVSVCGSRCQKGLQGSRTFAQVLKVLEGSQRFSEGAQRFILRSPSLFKTISNAFTYSSKVLKGSPRFTRDSEVR